MGLKNKNQIIQGLVKYFSVLLVLSLVIIIGLGTAFLLWPKYKEIKEQEILSYDQKQEELVQKKQELAALKDLDQQLNQISNQEIERMNLLLPTDQNYPAIFRQIEQIGQENDLVLNRISISEGGERESDESEIGPDLSSNKEIRTLTLSIAFSGDQSYQKLKQLLASIENNLMILDVSSLNYSPVQQGYNFNILTYVYVP